MTKDLQYFKNLNYRVEIAFDDEDKCWYARIPELGAVLADGATSEEALKNVLKLKDEVLELDYKKGISIAEPRPEIEYSGRFLLRVPKSLHQKLAEEAEREETSINRLAIQILSEDLERRQAMATVTDTIKTTIADSIKQSMGLPALTVSYSKERSSTGGWNIKSGRSQRVYNLSRSCVAFLFDPGESTKENETSLSPVTSPWSLPDIPFMLRSNQDIEESKS